jgi:NAD(P)-dependent dehydrogenase (short-subunit alcohol dehydrogenase family)
MAGRVEGKVAFITGAARGQGRSHALTLGAPDRHEHTQLIRNEAIDRLFLPDTPHPTDEQAAEVFASTNALPVPWVEPVGISNAVLFLASEEARSVTGLQLEVDAGYTLK